MSDLPEEARALLQRLEELGIRTKTVTHAAAHTVEEARHLRGAIAGGHTKNLFLKDKKGRLFLVVAEETAKVDLKALPRRIGAARLSFGKPELLEETLRVRPGSVTPFALVNDREGRVKAVLDEKMLRHEVLNFHPLVNTATTSIATADFLRFLRHTGHEPLVVNVRPADED